MSEFCRVSFKINKENTKCTEQVKCKYTTLCNKAFSNERVIDYISYTMYKITTRCECVCACVHTQGCVCFVFVHLCFKLFFLLFVIEKPSSPVPDSVAWISSFSSHWKTSKSQGWPPCWDFQELSPPLAADMVDALKSHSFKLDLIAFFSKTHVTQIFNFRQYCFSSHLIVLANNRYDRDVEQ